MSGKTVIIKYNEKHSYYWLSWGNETFYDLDNKMLTWGKPGFAAGWLATYHPELKLIEPGQEWKSNDIDNLPLFGDGMMP